MFGFFKKHSEAKDIKKTVETKQPIDKTELEARLQEVTQALQSSPDSASLYEEQGLLYAELGQNLAAIDALDKSLAIKKNVGNGYKMLLKLANQQRGLAAEKNDEEALQYWLKKIDELMQISKDVTRGVY